MIDIIDSSVEEASAKRAALLAELDAVLFDYLAASSVDYRDRVATSIRSIAEKVFSAFGILRMYFYMFQGKNIYAHEVQRALNALRYKISSAIDAQSAYDRWFSTNTSPEFDVVKSVFEAKKEQLLRLEADMNDDQRESLAVVEANNTFASTYVMTFSRAFLEPRKYQIAFDITYDQPGSTSTGTVSAIAGIQISPYPISLSVFTAIAALLGAVLKTSLIHTDNIFSYLNQEIYSGRILIGPIVAIVLFNIYEHTSIGSQFSKMSVSWRSALLIGVMSGMTNERIIAALNAFIAGS